MVMLQATQAYSFQLDENAYHQTSNSFEETRKILISEFYIPLPSNTAEAFNARADKNITLINICKASDSEKFQLWALFLYNAMSFLPDMHATIKANSAAITTEHLCNKLFKKELNEKSLTAQTKQALKFCLYGSCLGAATSFALTRIAKYPKFIPALTLEILCFILHCSSSYRSTYYNGVFSSSDFNRFLTWDEKNRIESPRNHKIYQLGMLTGAVVGILYQRHTYNEHSNLSKNQYFLKKLSIQAQKILQNYNSILKTYSVFFPPEILELNEEFKKIVDETKYETHQEIHYLEFKNCLIQLAEFHKKLKFLAGL